METNDTPKPKRKLELKKEVITILQDEQMAKVFGGLVTPTPGCTTSGSVCETGVLNYSCSGNPCSKGASTCNCD